MFDEDSGYYYLGGNIELNGVKKALLIRMKDVIDYEDSFQLDGVTGTVWSIDLLHMNFDNNKNVLAGLAIQ